MSCTRYIPLNCVKSVYMIKPHSANCLPLLYDTAQDSDYSTYQAIRHYTTEKPVTLHRNVLETRWWLARSRCCQ